MKNDYTYLIGMNKKEVLENLGDEYNIYPSDTWFYFLKQNLLSKVYIFLYFDSQDVVIRIKLTKKYFYSL